MRFTSIVLSALFVNLQFHARLGVAPQSQSESEIELRVGVIAYQDSQADINRLHDQLEQLVRRSPRRIRVRVAFGTYGDVLHWMDHKYIDVAAVSAGVFAETLRPGSGHTGWNYLATMGLDPARSPFASAPRRSMGYHFAYHAVALVPEASPVRSVTDLKSLASAGKVQFLFVHPLSVSGRVAPQFALSQLGIALDDSTIQYTYSHSDSLRLLLEPAPDVYRVAFVWDDALSPADHENKLVRQLEFPELAELSIPQTAIVCRPDYAHIDLVAQMLLGATDAGGEHTFNRFDDWSERYGVIRNWVDSIRLTANTLDTQAVSLDELGRILAHYSRSEPQPPRIAVVLSGGGAKCAYQVGAIAAVEEKLAELRQSVDDPALDVALVVGTSGGAINAIPVALGITRYADGRESFRRIWESLDQQAIVRPPALVRWNMGLWFTALQSSAVWWFARRAVANGERRLSVMARAFIVLAAPQLLLAHIHWTPWRLLGNNHLVHHIWLWASFGIKWSAWCMLAVGLSFLAIGRWLSKRFPIERVGRALRWVVPGAIVALPGLQFVTIFFFEATLTDGTGIEHQLAERIPGLVNDHRVHEGEQPYSIESGTTDAAKLELLSREILHSDSARAGYRGALSRDLVLTGSCLSKTAPELPNDLYFFAAADSKGPAPRFGKLGVPLVECPQLLFDVVMGSGSIFPAFPARLLHDFPRTGERVELIDGGFAHNSPIEAAVLWGATHIILIEASPSVADRTGERNFLQNSIDAFNHLYDQAQLADARSKGKVTIFTLRPQPPHICVLDFANNLVEQAIAAGYREARGEVRDTRLIGQPSWQKALGEPIFSDANSTPAAPRQTPPEAARVGESSL